MRKEKWLVLGLFSLCSLWATAQTHLTKQERKVAEAEAVAVINRFTGGQMRVQVQLTLPKDAQGHDSYAYQVKDNTLFIQASDGVAACRGFYDYVKAKGAGISSWSGNRFSMPADMQIAPRSFTSPYRDHQYMNVVTYGYTAPYWDQERWDQELDWMALHGIDMPLLLIAQEQVYREVFYDMGLTKEEIDEWEVGPAHLPWMRMGNLSGNSFDGPLGESWNQKQVELCRHVIGRMRKLGMKPICPAFGGFVPKAFVNHYAGKLDLTGWDWVPQDTRNYRLNPGSEAFVEVGTRFIRKWEEKFGKCQYYLSDSFNEMEIPHDHDLMTAYGDAIYKSIRDANPDAVWTMQGWTLGYQRSSWGDGILKALLKNVPDDKFMALDMATDYNRCFWNAPYDWDTYEGFYGKEWVWSVIPNMGGKTAYTGFIDYYANARLDAQNSPNRGNLTGYGMAPEGVENNEMLYELITDGGWVGARDSIDVPRWMEQYATCRYGSITSAEHTYYKGLRQSVYNSFQDHPQFGWQVRNNITGSGNVNLNAAFCQGVEQLFADAQALKSRIGMLDAQGARLYQLDLIETASIYASGKLEKLSERIRKAVDAGQTQHARELLNQLESLMLRLDRALTAHPLYNLKEWEVKAMKMAGDANESKRNAVNARRIVSVWYGNHEKDEPVNDYACRMWAGLIRDYYLPRLVGTWKKKIDGQEFDQIAFENSFVNKAPLLSQQTALGEPEVIGFLVNLVHDAQVAGDVAVELTGEYALSDGMTNHWYLIHGDKWAVEQVLTIERDGGVKVSPDTKAGEQFWRMVKRGDEVVFENRWGTVCTQEEARKLLGNFKYEAAPVAMIPEVISNDCDRYQAQLDHLLKGHPKMSAAAKANAEEAKALLNQWKGNIAHASYDQFLAAWTPVWNKLIGSL